MKDDKMTAKDWLILLVICCVLLTGFYFLLSHYVVYPTDVVIKNPTEEQILALYEYSGDANRVWIEDVDKVFGDNSLYKVTITLRNSEYPDKIYEALEYANITTDYAIEKR